MLYEQVEPIPKENSSKIDQKQLNEISQTIVQTKEDIVRESSEMITKEVEKLGRFKQQILSITARLESNKKGCEQKILNLEVEVQELNKKVDLYERQVKSNNIEDQLKIKIKKLNYEYLEICKERIQHAKSIEIKKLNKVQIEDRKSRATQVFKWILVSMYMETESKFYWPNFKEQAFEKDRGNDFIERLGKIKALQTKEEQRIKTEWFLENYQKIIKSSELKGVIQEMQKIKNVAICFRKGYQIGNEIKENEEKIQKHKQETLEKDQESMRWRARSQALSDRIDINRKYLRVINSAEQNLKLKLSLYDEKIESGKKIEQQFDSLNKWTPSIQIKTKNQNCECSMF